MDKSKGNIWPIGKKDVVITKRATTGEPIVLPKLDFSTENNSMYLGVI